MNKLLQYPNIKHIQKLLLYFCCFFLSTCGFHLRGISGEYKLPFDTVYLDCNNVKICPNLKNAITTQDLAKITSNPESAQVTIALFDEQTSRAPQSFTSAGRIASYVLNYQVQAKVIQHGNQLGNNIFVSVQSTMNYNDSTILASNQNENSFWDNLHQNATNQLIRRLVHFRYFPYTDQNANNSN